MISLKDVEILEGIFATYTDTGWIIPQWLIYLRTCAERSYNA